MNIGRIKIRAEGCGWGVRVEHLGVILRTARVLKRKRCPNGGSRSHAAAVDLGAIAANGLCGLAELDALALDEQVRHLRDEEEARGAMANEQDAPDP